MRHIITALDQAKEAEYFIEEIWLFESVHHGDGAILNAKEFGDLCEPSVSACGVATDFET